jgi:hypothetical protein
MPSTPEVQMMKDDSLPVTAKSIDEYFKNYMPTLDFKQQVRITAAVMELLRMVGGVAAAENRLHPTTAPYPLTVRVGLVELLASLCPLPWEKVSFSMTAVAFKHPGNPIDIFEGLKSFATLVETEPEAATREVFDALLEPPGQPVAKQVAPLAPVSVKTGAELVSTSNLARVFQPAKFQPDGTPAVELLSWQSELPGSLKLGPQLAAVSLESGPWPQLLLETGEFKRLPENVFTLARTTDATDYATVPPYLLACLRAYATYHNRFVDPPSSDEKLDARFGKFTQPLHCCLYSATHLAPLATVFDYFAACPPGGQVTVTLPIDQTPYFVTLEARVSENGPYVTAKLLDAQERVVMRLDTPRLFDPTGVYLFPLENMALALIVH